MLDTYYTININSRLLKQLILNNKKLDKIMANLTDLSQKVDELQASVDAEQVKIQTLLDGQKSTIASLESHIAELQALVNAAPTPEQLQIVVDKLQVTKEDIESTIVDTTTTTTTIGDSTTTTTTVDSSTTTTTVV